MHCSNIPKVSEYLKVKANVFDIIYIYIILYILISEEKFFNEKLISLRDFFTTVLICPVFFKIYWIHSIICSYFSSIQFFKAKVVCYYSDTSKILSYFFQMAIFCNFLTFKLKFFQRISVLSFNYETQQVMLSISLPSLIDDFNDLY